jgi:hypothetical protein
LELKPSNQSVVMMRCQSASRSAIARCWISIGKLHFLTSGVIHAIEIPISLLRISHSSSIRHPFAVIERALLALLSYSVLRRARGALARWILVTILCAAHQHITPRVLGHNHDTEAKIAVKVEYHAIFGDIRVYKKTKQVTDGQQGPA